MSFSAAISTNCTSVGGAANVIDPSVVLLAIGVAFLAPQMKRARKPARGCPNPVANEKARR
jgi:hypothetical protein